MALSREEVVSAVSGCIDSVISDWFIDSCFEFIVWSQTEKELPGLKLARPLICHKTIQSSSLGIDVLIYANFNTETEEIDFVVQ